MVIMEPVQNSGGAFTAPAGYWAGRARDLRPLRDPAVRRRGHHRLRPDRRVVRLRALRHPTGPDHDGEGPFLGVRLDRRGGRERRGRWSRSLKGDATFTHGLTFGGHPVQAAIALKNLEIMRREALVERVRENEEAFRATLEQLADLPIVGDIRGAGYFWAIELVADKETKATFTAEESEWLLRGFLSERLYDAGLICRADDRGDPVIQLSPPLIAGQAEFDRMVVDPRRGARRSPRAGTRPRARRRCSAHASSIAVIGGDGVGPEVVAAGLHVLRRAAELDGAFELLPDELPWGSAYYGEHGRMAPEGFLENLRGYEAIYLGAVGWPVGPRPCDLVGPSAPDPPGLRPVREPASCAG